LAAMPLPPASGQSGRIELLVGAFVKHYFRPCRPSLTPGLIGASARRAVGLDQKYSCHIAVALKTGIQHLTALDHVYGYNDKKKSPIREVSRTFDERTNEHVIMLEYRVRRGGDGVVTRSPSKKDPANKQQLLSQLAARARGKVAQTPPIATFPQSVHRANS